jgi:hypothetical protein
MITARKFSWKAFISFYIAFSFLVLGVSGIVLYVAPPGRIANWSVWTLIALSKAQWQAVHTLFAFVFLVAAGFHLYFNWKVLVAYLKSKLHDGVRMKRELGSASAAGALLLALTIGGIPPFSTVMDVGDDIKNAWTVPSSEPPLPHAEELTVEKLAETVKMPTGKAESNLQARGVRLNGTGQTVQQIADANRLTPQQVYQRMQSDDAKPQAPMGGGGGWGRKTVEDICRQYSVPVDTGVARLAAAGFEAAGSTPLKDLALKAGRTPVDVAKLIVGPDATITSPTSHQPGPSK